MRTVRSNTNEQRTCSHANKKNLFVRVRTEQRTQNKKSERTSKILFGNFGSCFLENYFFAELEFLLVSCLEMEESVDVASSSSANVPPSKYDLNKGEGDLQRHFIYKTVKEGEKEVLKGQCRKCSETVPRTGGSTTCMLRNQEKCDNEAWKIYKATSKSRKSNSAPSSSAIGRTAPTQCLKNLPKISLFAVQYLSNRNVYFQWLDSSTRTSETVWAPSMHKCNCSSTMSTNILNNCLLKLFHTLHKWNFTLITVFENCSRSPNTHAVRSLFVFGWEIRTNVRFVFGSRQKFMFAAALPFML